MLEALQTLRLTNVNVAIYCLVWCGQVPESDTVVPLMPVRAIDGDRGDNATLSYRVERYSCLTAPPVPPMACQQRSDQLAAHGHLCATTLLCTT